MGPPVEALRPPRVLVRLPSLHAALSCALLLSVTDAQGRLAPAPHYKHMQRAACGMRVARTAIVDVMWQGFLPRSVPPRDRGDLPRSRIALPSGTARRL